MHNSLKIIKTLLYSYSTLHVSGALAPIIRSPLILHIQPPVTVCRCVGCIFQLWSATTVAIAFPLRLDYGRSPHAYVYQRLQRQLELLMMSGVPLETC
jgi:hypothetical protein